MVDVPTRSRIEAWTTGHLQSAAQAWERQADAAESLYEQAQQAVARAPWEGDAADRAHDKMFETLTRIRGALEPLRKAASIARSAVSAIDGAKNDAVAAIRQRGVLMRFACSIFALLLVTTACSPNPTTAAPPPNFPDLSGYTPVEIKDSVGIGKRFLSPDGINCSFDWGAAHSIVCSGNVPSFPSPGSGCPIAHRVDESKPDSPYVLARTGGECTSYRVEPVAPGTKMFTSNGSCAVAKDGMVACIDTGNRHGFVLHGPESWAF